MLRKTYSEEFKRDAVAMYEDTDGVSLNSVTDDLGVNRGSLAMWVKRYGTGKKSRENTGDARARTASDAERIRQLERRLAIGPASLGLRWGVQLGTGGVTRS